MEGAILRALAMTGRTASASKQLMSSDIVRFRPKGAIDRRIKVEYIADPGHAGSVLLRLTPASTADLPSSATETDLLSSQQAADLLGVSRPYLTKLVDQGIFQGVVRTASGHRRVPRAEVERVHAAMRSTRRAALDEIDDITKDLRNRELKRAHASSKRRWVPKSA